jgi:rare lipoprotein A
VNAGRLLAGLAVATVLSACVTPREPSIKSTLPPATITPPQLPDSVPDAMPRIEPKARSGNPPFYDVFGKRYFVLSSSVGYVERGVASWYGPGFHRVRTSTGEPYDMYGMTAAHKTLPLPAFVRVTNLQNGRSVVVRVNDRGPFVGNRIIDSYVPAAATATATAAPTAAATATAAAPASAARAPVEGGATGASGSRTALFVQAGAFSDPANAERLAEKLRGGSYGKVFVRDDQLGGRKMYRVRIGPVPDVAEFDRVVAALGRAGISDAHLALD